MLSGIWSNASAAFTTSEITVDSYAPNYIPVSDPEIKWENVEVERAMAFVQVGLDPEDVTRCTLKYYLKVGLKFKAANGVTYKVDVGDTREGSSIVGGTGDGRCGQPRGPFNYEGDKAKALLSTGLSLSVGHFDYIILTVFSNEYVEILKAINAKIATYQAGLPLPPPDPNDSRKLAVPVLFVHGIGDSAERWGVSYARRECYNPVVMQMAPPTINTNTFVTKESRLVSESGGSTLGMEDVEVKRCASQIYVPSISARCSDGSTMVTDEFIFGGWVQPGTTRDLLSSYPEVELEYLNSLIVPPQVDPSAQLVRFVWAHPSEPQYAASLLPGVASIPAELLALQQDASHSYVVEAPPSVPMETSPFRVVTWDGRFWTLYRADISFKDIAAYASFRQDLHSTSIPADWTPANGDAVTRLDHPAQKEGLVSMYANGSAPDILARIEHLDRSYKWWNPYQGVNDNGIYFFSAWADGIWGGRRGSPPAPWNPADYPEFVWNGVNSQTGGIDSFADYAKRIKKNPGGRGAAFQVFHRMIEVLDKHYGKDAWKTNPDAKIDLVAHSQGGLLVRDMLANQKWDTLPDGKPMPKGLEHPGAHIRKFVVSNSPNFGSTFSAKEDDISGEYGAIRTFKEWMKNEQELKPKTKINLATVRTLLGANGLGMLLGGEETRIAAVYGTDVYWAMRGKALGPYQINVLIDLPGPWDEKIKVPNIDPPAMSQVRDQLLKEEQWSYHLSPTSKWITDLKDDGYPYMPGVSGVGTPLWTRPLYTASLPKLRGDIARELGRIQSEYCDEHATDWIETCDIVSWMLTGAAGYDGKDQGRFYDFFRDFHNQWTTKSDLVVEASSQMMVDIKAGFNPDAPALQGHFQAPQEYLLQRRFGTGSSKEVAHGPINQVEEMQLPSNEKISEMGMTVVGSSTHRFELRRPGAPRMGPDIYAALYDTNFVSQGIQPVAPHAQAVSLPALVNTSGLAGRLAGDLGIAIQDAAAKGDFSVRPWSQDRLVQGIGVRSSPTGRLQAAVFYDRRQGAFLWTSASAGQEAGTVALGNGNVPPLLTLTRTGNTLKATATYQDGVSRSGSIEVALPTQVRVGVLSSAEGRTEAVTPAALLGTFQAVTDALVDPYQEWNLATYVREMSAEANQSKPRIVLHNADTRPLQGVSLEYWFTGDPARKPVVEFDRSAGVTWTVEHFGGDQYVLKIQAPQAVVAAGGVFPDAEGLAFRIHNQDWSPRWNRGDWSRDRNIGIAQQTSRIVVRALDGRILAGDLPSAPDPLRVGKVRVLARDAGAQEANAFKPEIRLRNVGAVPLKNFRVRWIVQLPDGAVPQVDDWSQAATLSKRPLGNGLWEVEAYFDRFILYPQQDAPELKTGLHLPDWSAWDKSLSPSKLSEAWGESRGIMVLDENGRRIWGDLPEFPSVLPELPSPSNSSDLSGLVVSAREESPGDHVYARPRVRVTNAGTSTIKGFKLGLWVHNPAGSEPILDAAWYVPGCAVSMSTVATGRKVSYACPDVSLAPGAVWPDPSGSVIGLHLPQWQAWNRSDSWSLSGLTETFAPSDHITIETPSGALVKGVSP